MTNVISVILAQAFEEQQRRLAALEAMCGEGQQGDGGYMQIGHVAEFTQDPYYGE